MTDQLKEAVHRDLLALAHDLGRLLAHETGGTVAVNEELAADYLIGVFGAQGGEATVTGLMLEALEARKAELR